ncbi:hypothetical protein [Mycolicibacterium fallax]|uniref:hypothetical protein n=1 Tax=Mycolicibacterium fallax TaxID=1793 RepID=UPI001054270A|nr:hypothetical protein [Mycolicibacterium fallax]BBY99640.1 hypothetical protein MFAL_31070 [Mycolicibacterium fallax]
MTAAISIPYRELRAAQRRAIRAEECAAAARRERDDLTAALYEQGVPQTHLAQALGITQSYVSQRIAQRRKELAHGTLPAPRHNEDNAAPHQRGEGGEV